MRPVKLGKSHLGMQLKGTLQELSCGIEKWESDLLKNLQKNWIVWPRTFRYIQKTTILFWEELKKLN